MSPLDLPEEVQMHLLDALADGLTRVRGAAGSWKSGAETSGGTGDLPGAEVTRALWGLTRALGIPVSPSQRLPCPRPA